MRAQGQGFRVLGVELLDELGPQHAGGAHFGHFHEVVLALGPEEGEARGEGVNVNAGLDPGAHVFQAVRKRVRHFQVRRGAGFLHVVAGDGNGVEFGHVLGGELKDVRNDFHGGIRRIDVGVAHHVFLENVVLDRAGELVQRAALFLGGHDVEGQHGQHGAVHGHGNGHLVQRNALEEDFHVQDGVHGHAGLAHVTHHAGVVGVIAAVRRQVKGDGEALLAGRQVAAVEGVGFLRRGEACVLSHRPGTGHVHGGVRSAEVGGHTGGKVQVQAVVVHAFRVGGRHGNLFIGHPGFRSGSRGRGAGLDFRIGGGCKIRNIAH